MTNSYTVQDTFTILDAKHIAARVATDLRRMQRFYGSPSDLRITSFETEIVSLLKAGYLDNVTYGFQRNGNWIPPTLKYTARELLSMNTNDDDPGRVLPGADIQGASFHSFLIYSGAWFNLSERERNDFENTLPFQRSEVPAPGINGYFSNDKIYSSGGRALDRSTLKSYT